MVDLPDPDGQDAESLAKVFRYFGEVETPRLDSAVYTAYSLGVADDPELLALATHVQPSQPAPNVLYAAVKDLLLEDPERSDVARALARFYPSISGGPIPAESAWPAFRRFCLENEAALVPRIRTGRTQTCVVHRSAIVLPALARLPRLGAAGGRVGLLEIGPSVGLNLRLDHYRFVYRDEAGNEVAAFGDRSARPVLECVLRGAARPPLPAALEVVARTGLELAPIDVTDPKALRWLRALIWPEHVERARLMDEALEVAARVPVDVAQGDATVEVESAARRLPTDAARVVFATHALYQIPAEGIEAMLAGIARASDEGPIDLLTMESNGQGSSAIEWIAFEGGRLASRETIAESDSHGRWLAWSGA